jgi:hypothetical protein
MTEVSLLFKSGDISGLADHVAEQEDDDDLLPESRNHIVEMEYIVDATESYDLENQDSADSGYEAPDIAGTALEIGIELAGDVTTGLLSIWIYKKAVEYDIEYIEINNERISLNKEAIKSALEDRT